MSETAYPANSQIPTHSHDFAYFCFVLRGDFDEIYGKKSRFCRSACLRSGRTLHRVIKRIPRGETRSYKEIAAQISQPKAVRAVARACTANPVALITPCHRVVGASGALSGYRWGIERKKKLLETEKQK